MYCYSNGQISLAGFKQPVGMNLKESNRWVKKARRIPWPEIEKRYAALFTNRKGNVAKPLRLALGVCMIQAEYAFSDDACNEAGNLQEMAERFRAREGHCPSRILADKIYRNRENLNYCKAHGIRLSGPAPGRPKKGETRDKVQDYRDECERVEVERRFRLAKRKCGMGLITAKLRETTAHVIGSGAESP